MAQHAAQLGAALEQAAAEGDQGRGIVGLHAGAMAIGIDLDQYGQGLRFGGAPGSDRLGLFPAVEQDGQIGAVLPADRADPVQPARRDADAIDQVANAVTREIFGLFQGRDHGRPIRPRDRPARRLDALRRLEMRPERDAERRQMVAHPGQVALETRLVEQQAGGWQSVERHGRILAVVQGCQVHSTQPTLAR